jgi:hypothetical protein
VTRMADEDLVERDERLPVVCTATALCPRRGPPARAGGRCAGRTVGRRRRRRARRRAPARRAVRRVRVSDPPCASRGGSGRASRRRSKRARETRPPSTRTGNRRRGPSPQPRGARVTAMIVWAPGHD